MASGKSRLFLELLSIHRFLDINPYRHRLHLLAIVQTTFRSVKMWRERRWLTVSGVWLKCSALVQVKSAAAARLLIKNGTKGKSCLE